MNTTKQRARIPPATSLEGRVSPILLATDGSTDAQLAAAAVSQMHRKLPVDIHVVHCWMPVITAYGPAGVLPLDAGQTYQQPAALVLAEQVAALKRRKLVPAATHLLEGRATELVPQLAVELGACLIVIGSRGLGAIKRLVLGSVSEGIVHAAHTPVLVVRGARHAWPPTDIIVGDDGSSESHLAALSAASIARATGARLRIVHVIPTAWKDAPSPRHARTIGAAAGAAQATIEEIADEVERTYGFRPKTSVLVGEAAAELVFQARRTPVPAMLAVGSRGLGAVQRLTLGSVSTNVLRGAPGPVLVCPHPSNRRAARG